MSIAAGTPCTTRRALVVRTTDELGATDHGGCGLKCCLQHAKRMVVVNTKRKSCLQTIGRKRLGSLPETSGPILYRYASDLLPFNERISRKAPRDLGHVLIPTYTWGVSNRCVFVNLIPDRARAGRTRTCQDGFRCCCWIAVGTKHLVREPERNSTNAPTQDRTNRVQRPIVTRCFLFSSFLLSARSRLPC